jgi:hypothetical protein
VTNQETAAAWEEERAVSKYAANLEQLTTGRRISPNPKDWKCDETGVTENLWLNLSTGHIGSGRAVSLCKADLGQGRAEAQPLAHVSHRQTRCKVTPPLVTDTHMRRTGTAVAGMVRLFVITRPPGKNTPWWSSWAPSRRRVGGVRWAEGGGCSWCGGCAPAL